MALRGRAAPGASAPRIAFFGVRGIGSIYYVAYAVGAASFTGSALLWQVVGLVVAASVVLHGLTAGPVMALLDRRQQTAPTG